MNNNFDSIKNNSAILCFGLESDSPGYFLVVDENITYYINAEHKFLLKTNEIKQYGRFDSFIYLPDEYIEILNNRELMDY